jgi:hypothetical protein
MFPVNVVKGNVPQIFPARSLNVTRMFPECSLKSGNVPPGSSAAGGAEIVRLTHALVAAEAHSLQCEAGLAKCQTDLASETERRLKAEDLESKQRERMRRAQLFQTEVCFRSSHRWYTGSTTGTQDSPLEYRTHHWNTFGLRVHVTRSV